MYRERERERSQHKEGAGKLVCQPASHGPAPGPGPGPCLPAAFVLPNCLALRPCSQVADSKNKQEERERQALLYYHSYLGEEFTRLAETRLAQNTLNYLKITQLSYLNIS